MRIFFIVNARRGRSRPADKVLQKFENLLASSGHEYAIELSESIDHAKQLCDNAAGEGYDSLWIGGGDGTINVLLNHTYGRGFTYGVVPMGTVNALARSFGIPLSPEKAVRHLLAAKPMDLDVGEANGIYFVCFASVGFDAGVVHGVTSDLKRKCGKFAYVVKGLQAVTGMRKLARFEMELPVGCGKSCTCTSDTLPETETGNSFILSNICNYAGFRMFHEVQPCSGEMELYLFRRNRLDTMMGWLAASVARNAFLRQCFPTVGHYMISEFIVRSEEPMYLQLDGEAVSLGNNREYRFRCIEKGISLLV